MKALRYPRPRCADIVEVPTPRPTEDQILAKSLYCSVSAGTEMGFYRGTAPQLDYMIDSHFNFVEKKGNITYPMSSDKPGVWWMGYSNVAEVLEAGPDARSLKPGDVVFTRGGHRTHQLVREADALKLPSAVDYEGYALSALVEIAFNAMLDAQVVLGETAVVSGLGTIGQLVLQMLKASGCRTIAVDGLANRLELARRLGADEAINFKEADVCERVYASTGGRGADAVIEASGNEGALENAVRAASYNGRVVVVSFYQGVPSSFHMGREFHHKRTSLVCSQICGINPALSARWTPERRMQAALELVPALGLAPLVSHRVAFEELPATLAAIDARPSECSAVIVKY